METFTYAKDQPLSAVPATHAEWEKLHQDAIRRREDMLNYIDETCPSGTRQDTIDHVCDRTVLSPVIWEQENTDHRIDPATHNANTVLFAYGGTGSTLRRYQTRIDELTDVMNTVSETNNVGFVQDPRCDFVTSHLQDANKYIFLNENNLLSHPSGPKEPNLCYIPPRVSNVLYHPSLCSASNELIFHKDFEDVVEIRGLDVHGVTDKDVGKPVCVLRFKEPSESGLTLEQHHAKLGDYLQYLYKQDPERQ